MTRVYVLGIWCASAVWGAQSLQITAGRAQVAIPNVAPYATIGSSAQSMRWEMRLHTFGGMIPNYTVNAGGLVLGQVGTALYASPGGGDKINWTMAVTCCQSREDILIRVTREADKSRYSFTVCDTTGGNCQTVYATIVAYGAANSWVGQPIYVQAGASVAFLRWYSTLPTSSAISPVGPPGDLGNWEFEGDTTDTSGNGLTLSGGTRMFRATPTYAPACSAGVSQTARSSDTLVLDGSGSAPLDGDTRLTYTWEQTQGPNRLTIANASASQATASGLAAGEYVFSLGVIDSLGQRSECSVTHGVVEADRHDVVVTGNTAVDTLLGPLIRFGANPWPWFDDRNRAAADLRIAQMDTYYPAYWDVADPGLVTVTPNSNRITGVGTRFTTTFCQGPSAPTTPKPSASIVVWYPTNNPSAPDETGRRGLSVASCESDTQLITGVKWPSTVIPAGSGLQYADNANRNWWDYGQAPANYYDNVAAFYSLYYRSGMTKYRDAARKLADRFWSAPQTDRGNGYLSDPATYMQEGLLPARSASLLGLVLRARDGRPDMWPGLHKIWDMYGRLYIGNDPGFLKYDYQWTPGLWDVREVAYHLADISYCALYDTDPVYRSKCQNWVKDSIEILFTQQQAADGGWLQPFGTHYGSYKDGSTVTLTHGSTLVLGNGTSWTARQFQPDSNPWYPAIWFLPTPKYPASNSEGEPTTYTPTFVDSTHLVLDRPYEGASGTKYWIGSDAPMDGTPLVGYGALPYMEGLLAMAFDYAGKALADVDAASSRKAHYFSVAAASWVKKYGYRADTGGLNYVAETANCQAPIPLGNNPCAAGGSALSSHEAIRGMMLAYAHSHDPTLQNATDSLYNSLWAKPGTCPQGSRVCIPSTRYAAEFDDAGWYMQNLSPTGTGAKWFGQPFGIGAEAAWPAIRAGVAGGRLFHFGFHMASVPGANAVRLTASTPAGDVYESVCSASPCAVLVNSLLGAVSLRLEYLSARGDVLARSELPVTANSR